MNGHVEVVRFELISHLSETLQGILSHGLLEAERLPGLVALLWGEETQCLVIQPACCLWAKYAYLVIDCHLIYVFIHFFLQLQMFIL